MPADENSDAHPSGATDERMGISRRNILRALVGTGTAAVLGSTSSGSSIMTAPTPATSAGLTQLRFDGVVSSLLAIDIHGTGAPGFSWYIRPPWGRATSPPSDFAIVQEKDQTFLRVTPSVNNSNWNLATMDPVSGQGRTFLHGFMEARLRFPNTPMEPEWERDYKYAWPSIWGLSVDNARGTFTQATEIDIFEAAGGPGRWSGTAHDFQPNQHWRSANTIKTLGLDFTEWRSYAVRWETGRVTWFVDDVAVNSQSWGANGPDPKPLLNDSTPPQVPRSVFRNLDNLPLIFVVGSGIGAPFDLQHFRVWSAP